MTETKPFLRRYGQVAPRLTDSSVYPDQVSKAYNFPEGLDLSQRTIGVLEFGGMYNLNDVIAYCVSRGKKVPTITNVFLDGSTQQSSDADGEVCLDLDIIAEIAAGCKIIVFFGANSEQGFLDTVDAAIKANVNAISCSWGAPESQWTAEGMANLSASMKAGANEKGIATFCASGDSGSNDGTMSPVTDFPASSPYAIACGGTALNLNADGTRKTETGWSSSFFDSEGSGGGISKVYPVTPDWQAGLLPSSPAGRRSPDISGNADPNTGYQVNINGQLAQVGGTSAVAPLYSALFCMINAVKNQHIGNLHTKLYAQLGKPTFYDVTTGNNGAYKDSVGYDLVTGCGVVDGAEFVATL